VAGIKKKNIALKGDDDFEVFKQAEAAPQSHTLNAIAAVQSEIGGVGVSFQRGPETEISQRKEVEALMRELSKHQINIPNQILQRAFNLPKD
jgi:hypothetical protein